MRANELMIGDFVTRQNYENKAVICKIIGLSKNSISVEFDNGSRSMGASEDSINPIPLTPEILKKNGFVEINDDEKWYKMQLLEENDFVGLEKLEDYYWMFAAVVFPNLINHLSIKYVHQLQHALKLCGINKEIVL